MCKGLNTSREQHMVNIILYSEHEMKTIINKILAIDSSSFKQTEKKKNFSEIVLVNTGAVVRTDNIQSFPAQISEMMAQLMFIPHSSGLV